jgi:anti-anti-sigma factor
MEKMEIVEITELPNAAVITFNQPNLGLSTIVEQVNSRIRDYVQTRRPKNIVIDFSSVSFFSSRTLGMLVDLWKRAQDDQGRLLICGIDPRLYRVFRITNLDKLFDFVDDRQAALSAVSE